MAETSEYWQKLAWDGISMRLPGNWQPAVIQKSYLLFEQEGEAVFAVKWQRRHGSFSPDRILKNLQDSFPQPAAMIQWQPEKELAEIVRQYSITGFQYQDKDKSFLGLLLFCPHCRRVTIFQHYTRDLKCRRLLCHILQTFSDHTPGEEQDWSIFDIRAQLPAKAELKTYEFLAGKYTISFSLGDANIELYRFKPAAAILKNKSLLEFGSHLAGKAACVDFTPVKEAHWEYTATGLDRLPVMLGRQPSWIWLYLKVSNEKNAILAVRGSGRRSMDRKRMQYIADNFTLR